MIPLCDSCNGLSQHSNHNRWFAVKESCVVYVELCGDDDDYDDADSCDGNVDTDIGCDKNDDDDYNDDYDDDYGGDYDDDYGGDYDYDGDDDYDFG